MTGSRTQSGPAPTYLRITLGEGTPTPTQSHQADRPASADSMHRAGPASRPFVLATLRALRLDPGPYPVLSTRRPKTSKTTAQQPLDGIVTLVSVGDLEGSVGVRTATASYKGHRYPVWSIGHCVWLYFRFSLSFREVEELMLARGVVVSYETIRRWCAKFGQAYANQLRRRRPRPGDKWHLDEVFIRINGKIHYLWRAVDQHGNVLDILVQPRRDAKAARKFF